MSSPAVTVVIPAFNAAEWIGITLSCVVAQTYPKDQLEIVVVDDGSTDQTAAVAHSLLAPAGIAYEVLRNAESQGPSAARNRGWRHGRGEWVQFLDSDDLLEPSKIELQARAAGDADSGVAALFSPWGRLISSQGRWLQQTPWVDPALGPDPLLDLLRTENFMQIGSLMFSRAWLEKTDGFIESYRLIEDVDLLLRMVMRAGVLRRVPSTRPLSWYRQRAGSLSRENEQSFIDGCVRNARTVENYCRDRSELTSLRAAAIAEVYFLGARFYAERDAEVFQALTRDIYRLEPRFLPRGPVALRLLTQVVGYTRAERCAVHYRRLKRTLRGAQTVDHAALHSSQ